MTDYWVSSKKHYCETCNCWLSGHKVNIKNHEKSARHIENLKKVISESFKRKEQETKEKELLERELKKLENVEKKLLSDLNKNETSPHRSDNILLNASNAHSNSRSGYRSSNSNNERINASNIAFNSIQSSCKKWVPMIHEDTGSLVFFNRLKNEIVYEKPKDFFEELSEHESFVEQNGWYKYFDYNSQNFYYFNIYSSKSVWQYSRNRIMSLMDFISRCEQAAQHNINPGNNAQAASLIVDTGPAENQHHPHLSGPPYYVNYAQMFSTQNYNVYDTYNTLMNSANTELQVAENTKEELIQQSSDSGGRNILAGDGNHVKNSMHCGKLDDASAGKCADGVGENGERNAKETKARGGDTSPGVSNAMEEENRKEKLPYEMGENAFKKSSAHYEEKNKKANISLSFKKVESEGTLPHGTKEQKEKGKMGGEDSNVESSNVQQDESAKPGIWEVVENNDVETISNEHIEQIFYNVKSKQQIEKEKIAQLEEDIRYEYSEYNEFYIKKKELENEEIYLNQEFKFVDKPIYKKVIDKNRDKKVDFAKRSIKGMKNKKKIT
ncbi:conserved Plasmodium protein, unknown function [Plasmodium knowlesi strain H]|uniref:Matrin-type domain-containing protein n=3 Tax=Plasmodium knowlesi TaxID=5850 RepID=A0A5K1VL53_PLAKH|nr:zinc finger protein, putative [Plasmodium knowlesi strain H]OTN67599.1 Uncharacterized protein PKNOH_S05399500 [Plasmodium knowlesi]CAA9990582.1 zinc finger protein, putative [Plasmodium knowlesi strain H]SBO19855.1 conserved Plasmodium protein, unknown function [Plasmodium knowlesi strain H]SBO22312.1 conserved Plasmodium protein, unknown function [Plasmodium knowlesi strain H]VVS80056.1 zinc finger protein, putative [Plasmodium knowlesi strain H]|eukprot:XP_002260966.1 hypothetical protein, conserved in Plasmodium species [Plasmodium knowlesi strain H]